MSTLQSSSPETHTTQREWLTRPVWRGRKPFAWPPTTKSRSDCTAQPHAFQASLLESSSSFLIGDPPQMVLDPSPGQGEPKPSPTTAKEPLARHASAIIPIDFKPPVQSASTRTTRSEEDCAGWRQRQTHCVNCGRLFFTILSPLSSSAGQFCSLDCKTSFEYVNHLEEVLAQHMLGEHSASLGSSSDEEDYKVEELDVEQLWS